MPDKPRTSPAHPEPVEGSILTDFTPVPRRFNCGDVWTAQVQRAFIEALADTGSVEAACRMVGRSPASAYRLRRHPLGGEFAQAWQAAVDFGIARIEDYAMDRALNGVEVPVFLNGGQLVSRRVYNDQLVMFMLRNRRGERYCEGGARGLSAIDNHRLARLKQAWREEWQRERLLLDDADEQETLDSIDQWLETMHRNRWDNMSPRARAAYEEAERIAKEDGTEWMLGEDDGEEEAEPADGGLAALLPPPEETEPKPEPRIRRLKDDDW